MTPTAAGRHCAACQKTVVDFTLKTDAEILAYLAKAAGSRTCGRFAAGQLERPLQRAAPVAPAARWRAWLAAAVAVWGVRESIGSETKAQAPVEMLRRIDKTTPEQLQATRKPDYEGTSVAKVLRGIVQDSATREGLPGVTVLIKHSTIGTVTNQNGEFELVLPAEYAEANSFMLRVSTIGYTTAERQLTSNSEKQTFLIRPDMKGLAEVVVVGGIHYRRPWPWHPRALYHWTKYQLMRPFRRL
jgi:hypothetical protein